MTEFERLQQMYREMGDEHLQDLADEPEELTDEARMALAAEMRRRGWTPLAESGETPVAVAEPELQSGFGAAIPGIVPAGASAVEQALEPGGEVRQGMVRLISFFDGHELTRACNALEDASLDFAIEEVAGDAMSGLAPHFEVWVPVGEDTGARQLLRARLGLFPLPEVESDLEAGEEVPQSLQDDAASDLVVAEFGSHAEAEAVRAMLAAQGFAASVESDAAGSVVMVPAAQQQQALDVVASRMGLS